MTVYLDLVVVLNFLVDLLLLLGSNRLSGFPAGWRRILPAAALGGVYGGACLLRRFRFLGNTVWRLTALMLMAILAFGWNRSAVKRGCMFVLLSCALGGVAQQFHRGGLGTLLMGAGSLWLLCTFGLGGTISRREFVEVTLGYEDRQVTVTALRDTGNTLRDPITGEQVLILSAQVASKLTGLTREQLGSPLETMAKRPLPGLRVIPYRTVGQSGGMLLGMRFSDCVIDGKRRSAIVAFSTEGLGERDMYQALTGGVL